MKARPFLLSFPALWLSLGATAQNAAPSLGSEISNRSTSSLHDADGRTEPFSGTRVVSPPNAVGESSSRHSFKRAPRYDRTMNSRPSPCERPAELFSASDYNGPLKRFAAWFSRKPEITTVPSAGRISGTNVCALDAGEKFNLFFRSTADPVTVIGAGAKAGISQWSNNDSEWGQGAEAYGKRYAAAFTDTAARNFFGKFFYPAIFRQDPRYFRRGNGTVKDRLDHALAHTFVARGDSGGSMPNFSLWAATASTAALGDLYHPGWDRGFGPAAQRAGINIGTSMGFDVLKEFWPEIVRKLNLPFRERRVVTADATGNE